MRALGVILAGGNNKKMKELFSEESNCSNAHSRQLPQYRFCTE